MPTIARASRRARARRRAWWWTTSASSRTYRRRWRSTQRPRGGDTPIQNKNGQVEALEDALAEFRSFYDEAGVDLAAIAAAEKLARLKLIGDAVESLIAPDYRRRQFLHNAGAAVHSEIRFRLNELPKDPYPQELWDGKVQAV